MRGKGGRWRGAVGSSIFGQFSSGTRAKLSTSTSIRPLFAGVFPPITTPFRTDKDQSVDYDHLVANVRHYIREENGLAGLVVLGSNGEFPLLSTEEKVNIFRTVKQAVDETRGNRQCWLIAGTGCVGTKETIDLTNKAKQIGYDASMIVTPYYFTNKMQTMLVNHYTEVASGVDGFPIILYNVPPMAGNVAFTVPIIKELASIPNIVGIKDTSGNLVQLAEIVLHVKEPLRKAGKAFSVLAGSGSYFYHALEAGADGGVMALANLLPQSLACLYNDFRNGNKYEKCRKLQQAMVEINQKVTAEYGSSGLKRALDWMGKVSGGHPRRPLRPLTPEKEVDLKRCLTSSLRVLHELHQLSNDPITYKNLFD
jgi:4-hydroxy-2-oxoglutarate aldolase